MARWKARCRLPISAIWTFFASYHGWGAMSKYWSKLCCLKGAGLFERKFQGKGVFHQQIFASENKSPWAITWCCLRDPTFGRFDTIPACVYKGSLNWHDGYSPELLESRRHRTCHWSPCRVCLLEVDSWLDCQSEVPVEHTQRHRLLCRRLPDECRAAGADPVYNTETTNAGKGNRCRVLTGA